MPAPQPPPWPRNAWYVAAMANEVQDRPLGRQICGERIVFFRGPDRTVAAVEDFCPHRGAALSLGFLREGALVCGYHGLSLGCDGRPVGMPGQRVERFPAIRAYPALERYGFIWVWPGEPHLADSTKLNRLDWAESDDWRYGGDLFHVCCDYRLMIDNLMDLSHETYVHANSIGQKEIDEAPVITTEQGTEVVTSRFMNGVQAPPFWKMALRGAGLPDDRLVDRWQVCRFSLPSHVLIEVGVALSGEGGYHAPKGAKAASIVVDFITPETEHAHWYFWGMARSFSVHDDGLTARIRDGQRKIFSEDMAVLEQQQQNLLRHPDRKLMRLNVDAGGVRARLRIQRTIAEEVRASAARTQNA